jgi:hypothetical protein
MIRGLVEATMKPGSRTWPLHDVSMAWARAIAAGLVVGNRRRLG